MSCALYVLITTIAIYFNWISWQSNIIVNILAFEGLFLSFLLLRYWICIRQIPQKPNQMFVNAAGAIINSQLPFFGTCIAKSVNLFREISFESK